MLVEVASSADVPPDATATVTSNNAVASIAAEVSRIPIKTVIFHFIVTSLAMFLSPRYTAMSAVTVLPKKN